MCKTGWILSVIGYIRYSGYSEKRSNSGIINMSDPKGNIELVCLTKAESAPSNAVLSLSLQLYSFAHHRPSFGYLWKYFNLEGNSGIFIRKKVGLKFRNFHPKYNSLKCPQKDTYFSHTNPKKIKRSNSGVSGSLNLQNPGRKFQNFHPK